MSELTPPRRQRLRLLYQRRRRTGNGQTDQLRVYVERPSNQLFRVSRAPFIIDLLLHALGASPYIELVPLRDADGNLQTTAPTGAG